MIDRKHRLPVVQQRQILEVSRSSVYYVPQPFSAADLALMRKIDELHLQYPFAGSRMLRDILQLTGVAIGRKHVATLMREWASRPSTSAHITVMITVPMGDEYVIDAFRLDSFRGKKQSERIQIAHSDSGSPCRAHVGFEAESGVHDYLSAAVG